ncbi:MAG: lipocalin family protein [Campylobacterales bacterium]|nr:lipocalin family protein [Campylobacterales bacterium]
MKYVTTFILILVLAGCAKSYPPLPTVAEVDVQRYLGTWYEIARYEHFFEEGCSNVTATYTLREDEQIDVLNSCNKEGELTTAHGVAYSTDSSFSKLKVSFFRPFYGDYQILMLGDNYEYAVIGEPSREYFWILSRTKKLPQTTLDMILTKMSSLGYDSRKLIWTPHE